MDTVQSVVFVSADGRDTIPVLRLDSSDIAGAESMVTESRLLGSVGPLVFVVNRIWANRCGVHGNFNARFVLLDLEHGTTGDVVTAAERAAWLAASRAGVAQRFRSLPEGESPFHPDSMKLTAYWPTFGGPGLGLALQYTSDACYACSDDAWSSYSRSLETPAPELPERLRPWAEIPATVRVWHDALAHDSALGWSRQGDTLLVWRHTGNGHETAWIVRNPPLNNVVRQAPGVTIAAGGRLWRWTELDQAVPMTACRDLLDAP